MSNEICTSYAWKCSAYNTIQHINMEGLYCLSMLYCIIRSTFSCIRGTYFRWHGTLSMICSAFSIIYGGYLAKLCTSSRITIICCANNFMCNTNNSICSQCVDTCGAIWLYTVVCRCRHNLKPEADNSWNHCDCSSWELFHLR